MNLTNSSNSSSFSLNNDIVPIDNSYKTIPHVVLFLIIFIAQFVSKRKEIQNSAKEDDKMNSEQLELGKKLQYRYIMVFQISKAADWCLGPFVFEFFMSYHNLPVNEIAHYIAISYISSFFLGPTIVGYLNDLRNKKISCIIYGFVISFSCLCRMIKNSVGILYLSQISYGIGSSMLYSSFENWLVTEAKQTISDPNTFNYILSGTFEK